MWRFELLWFLMAGKTAIEKDWEYLHYVDRLHSLSTRISENLFTESKKNNVCLLLVYSEALHLWFIYIHVPNKRFLNRYCEKYECSLDLFNQMFLECIRKCSSQFMFGLRHRLHQWIIQIFLYLKLILSTKLQQAQM